MKRIAYSCFALLMLLTSCREDNDYLSNFHLGKVSYYPSFLWCDAELTPLEKELNLEFSEDAKADKDCFVEIEFVDKEQKIIPTSLMTVEVNGEVLGQNRFRIASDLEILKLSFAFSPEAADGKYQGYMKIVNHKLDRFENIMLESGQSIEVSKWSITYEKSMNPLAKVLMWIGIIIFTGLFIWFMIIRPSVYPHFKTFKKLIQVSENGKMVYAKSFRFTGARKVVFSNRKVKQSLCSRIFIGEIRTVEHPLFAVPLTFTPKKKNAMAYGNGYMVRTNPIPKAGVTEIENVQLKIKIKLN